MNGTENGIISVDTAVLNSVRFMASRAYTNKAVRKHDYI